MKKYILLVVLITAYSAQAQQTVNYSQFFSDPPQFGGSTIKYYKDIDEKFNQFLGTWIHQYNNNQTFVVYLWKETMVPVGNPPTAYVDAIRGHYKLVQNFDTPEELTLYSTQKLFRGTSQQIPFGLTGASIDGQTMSGSVLDYSVDNYSHRYGLFGDLKMTIESGSSPTSAFLKATALQTIDGVGLGIPGEIVLTKL